MKLVPVDSRRTESAKVTSATTISKPTTLLSQDQIAALTEIECAAARSFIGLATYTRMESSVDAQMTLKNPDV